MTDWSYVMFEILESISAYAHLRNRLQGRRDPACLDVSSGSFMLMGDVNPHPSSHWVWGVALAARPWLPLWATFSQVAHQN